MKPGLAEVTRPLLLLSVAGLLWEAVVRYWEIPAYILPGPLRIATAIIRKADILLWNSWATLLEIILGSGLALIIGIISAILLHFSKTLEKALLPLLIASQTIPVFAIAPLLVLWFGYGFGSKVIMTALIVYFPITVNSIDGLKSADPDVLKLMTILEASPWQVFIKVKIPRALPFLFSGLKVGAVVSVIGAVIGEWVGARQGLGYLMIHANAQLQVDLVFAAIFCLSLMGIGFYVLVTLLERFFIPWREAKSPGTP